MRSMLEMAEADLGLVGLHGDLVVDAGVGGVNGKGADVAQQVVDFAERAFRGLDDVAGVLAVGDRLVEAVDLSAQTFGDDQAGRIIGGAVDAQSAGDSFSMLLATLLERSAGCAAR